MKRKENRFRVKDDYEVNSVSNLVTAYHLAMMRSIDDEEELDQIKEESKKRIANSIRTSTAHYFINCFLPYIKPEMIEAILIDQIDAFDITSKRDLEENIGLMIVDGSYGTLFKVLAPTLAAYKKDMFRYLNDLREG